MRILIIRPFPEKLNIDSYNVQEIGLAKALVLKGNVCDIVFFENGKNNSEQVIQADNGNDIRIYWRKGINFAKNGWFFGLKKLIKSYDVIQVHEYDQMYSWYLYTFCKKPIVVYHGPYYSPFNKRYNLKTSVFDKLLLNKRNTKKACILTKSELASKYLKSKGFSNVKTVGVGLDSNKFVYEKPSENVMKIMEAIEGCISFLYVGKIEERRNNLFMLDVFSEVNKSFPCKLVMVGKGNDEYTKKVHEKIVNNGLESAVIWEEKISQNQLSHLYSACNYFLFTTEYDIFGMVLLEAMYYGMVVFSSLNGGSSTLIESGKNGFIFEGYDKYIWAEKIKNVLKDDNRSIGKNARDTILTKYLWTSLANDFLDTYYECIRK